MRLTYVAALLVVGFLAIGPTASNAQGPPLEVTVPELTPKEVATAVMTRMDFLRWTREFKGKVVKWSGVVVEPSPEHHEWFKKWFRGELLQLDLKELRCDLAVPDRNAYEIGTTVTFIGMLGGYLGPDMEIAGQLARDKPTVNFEDVTIQVASE